MAIPIPSAAVVSAARSHVTMYETREQRVSLTRKI
jgi:hypothetical protein